MVAGNPPEWLPLGFTEKIKVKDGRKIKVYTDTSSGNKFYSKPAVTRYLRTVHQCNTDTEQIKLEAEDEPFLKSEASPESVPITGSCCKSEKKSKGKNSFKMVASESESADGIPPGWITEIRTSRAGNKIRNDRYYIDPNSGYIFSSKRDVLRYLETQDISSCATRPKRMELDDLQLIKNEIHSSSPDDEKVSEQIETDRQLVGPGESDSGAVGCESLSTKSPEEPDAKITEQIQDNSACVLEYNESTENSNEESEKNISIELTEEVKVTDRALAKTDSETNQKLPSSEIGKQEDEAPTSIGKSKKRKGLILPSRSSKRLAGFEPEIQSNLVPNKRALTVAAKRTNSQDVNTFPGSSLKTAAAATLSSDVLPAEEVTTLPNVVHETPRENSPLKDVKKPLLDNEAIQEEKQVDDITRSQESQLCFEFGNPWLDPCLEFAFKTLTEEIPYENTLAFSGCFTAQLGIPHNQSKPSYSDAPGVVQREILSHSEPLKQNEARDLLPVKNINFPTCSGISSQQSSSEVRNKNCPNLPSSGTEKQTDKALVSLRKSKKSKDPGLPYRTTKKLARSGVAAMLEFVGEKTPQQVEPINKVEKPLAENQAIPPGDKHKAKDGAISQESQLCYEFGSSWSDPCLEFAFKTLTGEIPIDDTLAFSGRFGYGVTSNQSRGPVTPSETGVRAMFQNELPPHPELLKKNDVIHLLPGSNVSFPTCSGVSSQQSSSEVRNKEYQTKVSLRK